MINKPFLVILTGLPASGKSTFASKLKLIIEDISELKVKIIDPDIIRMNLSTSFDHTLERKVRQSHLNQVEESLKNGYVTISDDLNYYTSMRHQLKEIASENGFKYYIIHLSTPLDICIAWNDARGKPVPDKVIYNIAKKFDYFNNYQWDSPIAEFDLTKTYDVKKEIIKLLNSLNNSSVKPKKESSFNDFAQKVDKITRKVVSDYLKQEKSHKLKKNIIKLRKNYLREQLSSERKIENIRQDFIKYLHRYLDN